MTTTNPLDDKVIIDRETLETLLCLVLNKCHLAGDHPEETDFVKSAQKSLAADLTGWAAVPVQLPESMWYAGQKAGTNNIAYRHASDFYIDIYRAMLEASPPLPGGGE